MEELCKISGKNSVVLVLNTGKDFIYSRAVKFKEHRKALACSSAIGRWCDTFTSRRSYIFSSQHNSKD